MDNYFLLFLGFFLTFIIGFFVASEFSIVNISSADLNNSKKDRFLLKIIKNASFYMSSAQMGITLATLLAGYCLEPAVSALCERLILIPDSLNAIKPALYFLISIIISSFLSMIIGEIIPKNLSIASPKKIAYLIAPFIYIWTLTFMPLIRIFNSCAEKICLLMKIAPAGQIDSAPDNQDIASIIDSSLKAGAINQISANILSNSIELSQKDAKSVLTPLNKTQCLDISSNAEDLISLAKKTGYSRFPVVDHSKIIGVCHIKQAYAINKKTKIASFMQPIENISEYISMDMLLQSLKKANMQIVAVIDEYGASSGIITLEDIIEELIGEVKDEYDSTDMRANRRGDAWIVSALLRPDELKDITKIIIPESDDYETIGGYFMKCLKKIPRENDILYVKLLKDTQEEEIEADFKVEIAKMDDFRIDLIKLKEI